MKIGIRKEYAIAALTMLLGSGITFSAHAGMVSDLSCSEGDKSWTRDYHRDLRHDYRHDDRHDQRGRYESRNESRFYDKTNSGHQHQQSETLYSSTVKVKNPATTTIALELDSPGILTINLKELGNHMLDALSFNLKDSSNHVLGSGTGSGVWDFSISSPGTLYTSIFADPSGHKGSYKLNISYQNVAAPVPLPAAGWLLLSALGGGAGVFRRKPALTSTAA